MLRRYFLFELVALVWIVSACTGSNKADNADGGAVDSLSLDSVYDVQESDSLILIEEEGVSVKADELFDDFFYNFVSDVKFQKSRTARAMRKKDETIFERFSSNEIFSVIYEHERDLELLKDTTLRHVGVAWISLDSLSAEVFKFSKRDGEWLLTDRTTEDLTESLDADFLNFYKGFVADTLMQIESIGDGVFFEVEAQEGYEEIDSMVKPEDWVEFCSDKPLFSPLLVSMDYGQKIDHATMRDILFRDFSSGISINYHFEKDDDKWFLKSIEI